MSVTSGFFNSVNGDRKYNAEQMSAIFDGIINDGIFANIGTAFTVSASTNYDITVGIGRAWFNSTWIYNDAILPMTLEQPEVILDRIDAVVIEVDHTAAVRAGNIKIVKGTPASTPRNPTMTHTNYVNQYPLAYIYRTAGSSSITQSNITSRIGTSDAPYITGILQVQNIDNIVAQWGAQWIEWYAATTNLGETEMQEMLSQWNSWYSNLTTTSEAQISSWMTEMQGDFESWFEDLQVILDGDVATALAARLLALEEKFDTLAKERAIYVPIEDSDNEGITDSVGRAIEGKTVFVSNSDEELARVETLLNGHIQDDSVHIITLIHEKTGTVHTLAGIPSGLGIFTAQFKATARFSYGDTFSDGYTAKPTGLDASLQDGAFVSGDVVTVTIDTEGKKLNFKLGGGINDTLPPLNPNMTGELADGVFTVTADKLPVAQADALAGAEWYYADHVPARPGDGTKVEFTREQLVVLETPKALSEYATGDIVKIRENNAAAEFIVAMHNYESSLNGEGRTLLVRKDIYDLRAWDVALQKIYSSSDIDDFANTGYKNLYSAFVQGLMGTTKFPCMSQRGGSVVTIEKSVFILSMTEYGKTNYYAPVEGSALAIAENLLISDYNGEPTAHYTRTITINDNTSVWRINATGGNNYSSAAEKHGFRPCFTIPSTTEFGSVSNELIEDSTARVQTLADVQPLSGESISDEGITVTLSIPWTESGYCYCRQFPYNSKHQYQTQLVGAVATNDPDYGSDVPALPEFEYTGTYQLIDDGDGNWRIKFTTSGTFTPARDMTVDVFLVGGGASGTGDNNSGATDRTGGGGGYTQTYFGVVLSAGTEYTITIGAGGVGIRLSGSCSPGGATSAFGQTANGAPNKNGGSGGGGLGAMGVNAGNGGSDGSNGATGNVAGGTGQGTTTREFGEPDGELYSGGGGGAGISKTGGNGGAGGPSNTGGIGGNGGAGSAPPDGIGGGGGTGRNTNNGGGGGGGYGGGGGAGNGDDYLGTGGNGFQGIAIIRNHREAS